MTAYTTPEAGMRLHPATAHLVDRFAQALREKLAAAEVKYGYSDTWLYNDWKNDLVTRLLEHVHKGDPRDVAAFCAFAWHHGWSITPAAPVAPAGSEGELISQIEALLAIKNPSHPVPGLARELLQRAVSALATRAQPPVGEVDHMAFGFGRFVVDTGCFQQKPAVFICPVDEPGKVGASARHLGHDRHKLLPGERVLTFPRVEQARAVADALVAAHPAEPAARDGGEAWAELAKRPSWEISFSGMDEEDGWSVHSVTGGVNDREWTELSRADTPLEAVLQALAASGEK